jgi:hypothetical protein
MKTVLKQVSQIESLDSLLGIEGNLAALYFGALPNCCWLTSISFPVILSPTDSTRLEKKLGGGVSHLVKSSFCVVLLPVVVGSSRQSTHRRVLISWPGQNLQKL